MSDWIFGTGPSNAKLLICGEAPGKYEEEQGKPFVGPSGELVTELLEVAGLKRSQVYVTNIVKIRPPNNDLEKLNHIQNPNGDPYETMDGKFIQSGYTIDDFLPLLWSEIDAIKPNCILALGSLACEILTGKVGIKNWRGSILPCINSGIKTIPTIHPAALFERFNKNGSKIHGMFTWKQKAHIQFDFIKAVRESQSPEWNIPQRNLRVIRSSLQLEQFFNSYKDYKKIYVDTEVYKSHLVCIGFAFTPYEGVSVPLIDLQNNENHSGIAEHELIELWRIVEEKLSDRSLVKIGQNFKADKVYWLEEAGFTVNNFTEDTMFKFHTLSPELPKGLAFQASVLTNEPFWKSEGKEYNPHKDNLDILLKYNAKDCVVNCECDLAMNEDLKEFGLEDFFHNFVMKLYPVYEKIEKKGIRIDKKKQEELNLHYGKLLEEENRKCKELLLEFGIEEEVNYNSPKQVGILIYGTLRCPQRADTSDETLTALMNNAVKDQKKKSIIKSILDRRSLHKIKETYANATTDIDGRIRCTYNQVGTETGRTSTSIIKKPLRNGKWGIPFQTIPRPDEFGGRIREMFIPDPGKILIEFDQSQAEARIVALLAEDYDLLALFDILDVHKLTAAFCYGLSGDWSGQELIRSALARNRLHINCRCDDCNYINDTSIQFDFLDQVTDEQRQVGKNTRHGLGYDLGPDGLSIKQKISLWRAKQAFEKVHQMSPKIKEVFHESIQSALGESRVFITPFGRRREFFERWGKELFREAYAHYPQSTIGDNTKRTMLAISNIDWIEILEEGHDSFLAQIPDGREKECYDIVKPIFEKKIDFEKGTIKRRSLSIPCNCKIGKSWGQMEKFK